MHAVAPNVFTVERVHYTSRDRRERWLVVVGQDLSGGRDCWRSLPTLKLEEDAPLGVMSGGWSEPERDDELDDPHRFDCQICGRPGGH